MIKKCIKPGLPLLLHIAFVFWAGAASAYSLCANVENLQKITTICLFVFTLALIIGLVLLISRRVNLLFLLLVACLIGISLGCLGSYDVRSKQNILGDGEMNLVLTLESDAKKSSIGKSATCKVTDEFGKTLKATCYFDKSCNLLTSETIRTRGLLKPLSESASQYSYMQGISANLTVKDYEVVRNNLIVNSIVDMRRSVIDNFDSYAGSQAGILQALVCGYRNTIQEGGDYDKYKICGLAHMVAVSGAHLAIVVTLLMYLLKMLKAPKKATIFINSLFVVFYCIFAGVPISAIRAAIMVVLSLFSFFGKRSATPLNALAICIIVFLVIDPVSAVSVSLFLSTASTFSILIFSRLIESWFEGFSERIKNFVISPIALTTSANIATLPFSVALFSQVSTIALLSNILITPLFSIACTLGVALSMMAIMLPGIASILITITSLATYPITISIDILSSIPYASIAVSLDVIAMLVLSIVMIVALYLWWPKLRVKNVLFTAGGIMTFFACLIFIAPTFEGDEIVILDIGQGDSILFKSEGKHFLIDTGTNDSQLKEEIAKNGIRKLDGVLISHHDDDHMGSLSSLTTYCEIDDIFISAEAYMCGCKNCNEMISLIDTVSKGGRTHGVQIGDKISVGKFDFVVISPDRFVEDGGNADSIVVKCDRTDTNFTALFGGDAEISTLDKLIKDNRIGDIDILKVSHHGSKKSVDEEVLDVLKPEVSLISVGAKNRYGHPSSECLDYLDNVHSRVFRTDTQGEIKVHFEGDKYSVESAK